MNKVKDIKIEEILVLDNIVLYNFFKRFYLFIHEKERERERERERQRHRQREEQAACREPSVGLDPRTPGSHHAPKADAKPLSHPGIPNILFFNLSTNYS